MKESKRVLNSENTVVADRGSAFFLAAVLQRNDSLLTAAPFNDMAFRNLGLALGGDAVKRTRTRPKSHLRVERGRRRPNRLARP